jgi:molybdate-binding protein
MTSPARYWQARVGGRILAYPVGEDCVQLDWHDGVSQGAALRDIANGLVDRTLVVAGCDPAAGLLAAEYARQSRFRMLVLRRSSRAALELLSAGKVHAAGIHLGGSQSDNSHVARLSLGSQFQLIRLARWEEGLAIGPRLNCTTVRQLTRSKARWIGREEGSGARQCQDEILGARSAPRRVATDHRSIASAIKCGWADVGSCVRLASEEAGLEFLKVCERDYDICFRSDAEHDPLISALLATLRSQRYRSELSELPGYYTRQTGELAR